MVKSVLLLIFSTFFSYTTFALNDLPHDEKLTAHIDEIFFQNETLSIEKLDSFKGEINQRKMEVSKNIENYLVKKEGKSLEKAQARIRSKGVIFIYDLIFKYLDQAVSTTDSIEQREILAKVLELEYSFRVEGVRLPLVKTIDFVKNSLKSWSISKVNAPEGEASNLVEPETGKYYSKEELEQMKNEGYDLSLLNPPARTSFWTAQNIPLVDIEKNYQGGARLYQGVKVVFPKKKAKFKKVRKTQSKPKIDITKEFDGKKITFKLKLGSEMHSEITSASLIAALGFNVDISRYVRDFKMTLPKGMSVDDFKQEWNSYYDSYDVDKYIKETGKTKKGKSYIVWTEALIETKPEPIERIGPWAWGELGHRSLRDVRGILLFNMWVANLDLKEAENNKLVLKPQEDGSYSFHHYQHDMGFAFGKIFREKPGAFQWNLVSGTSDQTIFVNFSNFQNNTGFDHVTYFDAKWMVRLIAQLSRDQIHTAVKLGGWPKPLEELLVEKLISRRNQLVSAFDLEDDYSLMDFNRTLTTEDGAVKNGILTRSVFDGYTQDFGNELMEVLEPFFKGMKNLAIKAAQSAAGVFDRITLSPEDLGFESDLVGEIQVTFSREVLKNKHQKGRDDIYLVEDKMRVKVGLANGVLFKGRANYIKDYKLIYPVKTEEEGKFHNGFIVNALLPYHARIGKLPEKYVLIVEDLIEAMGAFEIGEGTTVIGTSISKGIVKLARTVISNKHKELQIYLDTSLYNDLVGKIYAQLLFLRLPMLSYNSENGTIARNVYKIKYKNKKLDEVMGALDSFILGSDLSQIERLASLTKIDSDFVSSRHKFDFLGIFKTKSKRRIDDIEQVVYSESDPEKTRRFQMNIEDSMKWSIFGNSETKDYQVAIAGEVNENLDVKNPLLHINLHIHDKDTKGIEFGNAYIGVVNKIANDPHFLNFNPELHTKNNLWGSSTLNIKLLYDEVAMNKLLSVEDEDYWDSLANKMDISLEKLKARRKIGVDRTTIRWNYKEARQLKEVLKFFGYARESKTQRDRYMHLTDAISNAIWQEDGSYNPELISLFNSIIGNDHIFLKATLTQDEKAEMKYPARTPIYNETGGAARDRLDYYEFDFDDANSIWTIFDNQ